MLATYRILPNYRTVRIDFFFKILVLGKFVKYCPTHIKGIFKKKKKKKGTI